MKEAIRHLLSRRAANCVERLMPSVPRSNESAKANRPSPVRVEFGRQPPFQSSDQRLQASRSKFVLPDSQDAPTSMPQVGIDPLVTSEIVQTFLSPEQPIRCRDCIVLRASVPKATVNENGDPAVGKREIRSTGKSATSAPTGDAQFAEQTRQSDFGAAIAASFDQAHAARAFGLGHSVHHTRSSNVRSYGPTGTMASLGGTHSASPLTPARTSCLAASPRDTSVHEALHRDAICPSMQDDPDRHSGLGRMNTDPGARYQGFNSKHVPSIGRQM